MRKLLFLMAFVALTACDSGEAGLQDNTLGKNTKAGFNESVEIKDANGQVSCVISVVGIEDMRCPSDVVCVWDGYAIVAFETEGLSFSLEIGQSKEFSSGGSSFRLTLLDVTPRRTSNDVVVKGKAVFIVEKI